jgi:hypothetical protein
MLADLPPALILDPFLAASPDIAGFADRAG